MAITLDQLMAELPASTEAQVRTTRDRTHQAIRDAMRAECGLSMRGLGGVDDSDSKAQVSVRLLPGYPEHIAHLTFDDGLAPLLLLARYSRQLAATASATSDLLTLHRELCAIPTGSAYSLQSDAPIAQTQAWAAGMLRLVEKHDPVKRILAFNQDVLGTYQCSGRDGDEFAASTASIGLYWGVIGLVAQDLHCAVEDLTVVVLAHELAHAYTQLGADTDGRRWPVDWFGQSEIALVEGLAQYYAERTTRRVRGRYPNAHKVFLQLLAKQPPPYHAHEPWAPHVAPEAVRRAMLEVRRCGELTPADFERRLESAADAFVLADPRASSPEVNDWRVGDSKPSA